MAKILNTKKAVAKSCAKYNKKYVYIFIFEPINPKFCRDHILWMQLDLLLLNLSSPMVHIFRGNVSISAEHWHHITNFMHLRNGSDLKQNYCPF